MGESLAFSLLLALEGMISSKESVILTEKIIGFNNSLRIKKSGESNSGKLDSIGGVVSICFGCLGLLLEEEMVCLVHDFCWRICVVNTSVSVPLNPP